MVDENADYITITHTFTERAWLVAVMTFKRSEDSYVMGQIAGPMTYRAAVHLAHEWAKDKGLEVRR